MDSLFSRYATALLSLAKEEKKIKDYKDALNDLDVFLKENNEVQKYLESHLVKDEAKYEVVYKMTKEFKLKSLASFLKVLIKKHRIHYFSKIKQEYLNLANAELGILEGILYSATSLTKEEKEKVEKAISKRMQKPVELRLIVDSHLLGGVKVIVNDHIFDGSLLGRLNQMKLDLSERR